MNTFMIGMYGGFDYKKYQRDFREGFYGMEVCLFEKQEDSLNLLKEAESIGFEIGVHFPFRKGYTGIRDALFLSKDQATRDEAFNYIKQQLNYLAAVNPKYVLFHYPKPVILDNRVNWDGWRFADSREFVYEENYSFDEFKKQTQYLFEWLSNQGKVHHFMPVLELDALNRYVYERNFLEDLLCEYTDIKLCLDTSRLYIQDQFDPYFDAKQVIEKFAKYTWHIHLSNVQIVDGKIVNHHYPALPELNPSEGWAPIEAYLQIIRTENNAVKVMFEHRSDVVRLNDLDRCYTWVIQLLNSNLVRVEDTK